MVVRSILLTVALLPYLYYGTKDNLYHFRGRRVSLVEHVLHLGVGITIVGAIASAYRGRMSAMIGGLLLFLVAGAVDEFVYHRGLPEHETDLHAKGHMAPAVVRRRGGGDAVVRGTTVGRVDRAFGMNVHDLFHPEYALAVALAVAVVLFFPLTREMTDERERRQYWLLQAMVVIAAIIGAKVAVLFGELGWPIRAIHGDWTGVLVSGRSVLGR